MRVDVTVFNDGGSATVRSEPGPLVGYAPSYSDGQGPTVWGSPRSGQTVYADPGWTLPAGAFTTAWTSCDENTGWCDTLARDTLSVALTDADVGHTIFFSAYGHNAFGETPTWSASFHDPVEEARPEYPASGRRPQAPIGSRVDRV